MNQNNIDLFIITYKDFEKQVSNECYKVIDTRDLRDKYKICGVMDDVELNEFYSFFYASENYELKDYVGFIHYRRYFDFMDDVPNMNEIFKEHDLITRPPLMFSRSLHEQYAACHNIEDLDLFTEVVKDVCPKEFYEAYLNQINGTIMIPCNMFVMKRDDFLEYVKTVKDVMKEFVWRFGVNPKGKVINNEEKYIKSFSPNNLISYQLRTIGYLFERFTSVYLLTKFKNPKIYNVIISENKYNLKFNKI